MISRAEKFQVSSEPAYKKGSVSLKFLKDIIKACEAERKIMTKPHTDKKAAIDQALKDMLSPVHRAVEIIDDKMKTWWLADKKAKDDEAARVAEDNRRRMEKAKKPERVLQKVAPQATKKSMGSATMAMTWKARLKDPNDTSEVPREYMMVDMVKVNAAVRRDVREIGGFIIEEVPSIRTR